MASIHTPKSTGEYIGTVSAIGEDSFEISSQIPLTNGDGICFLDNNNHLQGTTINSFENNIVHPQSMEYITLGIEIYRNFDHKFNKQLANLPAERKISIEMRMYDDVGGIAVDAIDEDGNHVTVEMMGEFDKANNPEKGYDTIVRQLSKLGNTIFYCNNVKIDTSSIYFFPVSQINNLRREIAEALLDQRLTSRPVKHSQIEKNSKALYPETKLTYLGNVFNRKAETFYQKHGVKEFEPAAETGVNMSNRKVMTTKYCLRHELGICPKIDPAIKADDLILESGQGDRYKVKFECLKCGMEIYFLND